MPKADFPTIQSVVSHVTVDDTLDYEAEKLIGQNLNVADLDLFDGPMLDADAKATADVWELLRRTKGSKLVTTARKAADRLPAVTSSPAKPFLGGGTSPAATLDDWKAALATVRQPDEPVNVLVPFTDLMTVIAEAKKHFVFMSGDGRNERNGYVAAPADETLTDLGKKIVRVNDRNMSLVGQEILVTDATGAAVWRSPKHLAVLMGALQCSRAMGVPLTWKYPNVLDFRQNIGWNPYDDGEAALEKGLLFLERSSLGPRICRQLTTYLDEHEVYCEISRNESANESVKGVRRVQERFVGDPGTPGLKGIILETTRAELDRQVRDKEIFGFRNLSIATIPLGHQTVYQLVALGATTFLNTVAYLVREEA